MNHFNYTRSLIVATTLTLPTLVFAQFGSLFSSILQSAHSVVDSQAKQASDFQASQGKPMDATFEKKVLEFAESKPKKLHPFFRALYVEGERNAVLNLNQLGLAAMEIGEFAIAKSAFDLAIMRIDAIFADDPNAQKAKTLWSEEKVKDWKGEPYERAMTYYYRGLLYLKDGEYDNAAAAFRSADYQDTQAESEFFQGDFGIMPFMAAWAQGCRGNANAAKDLHEQAIAKDPSVSAIPLETRHLVLVDSGIGPIKTGRGQYREVLTFQPAAAGDDAYLRLIVSESGNSLELPTSAVGNLMFQATTRGGRPIDGILNGKAQWKQGTTSVGNTAMATGAALANVGSQSGNSQMEQFGLFGSLFGLAAKVAANNMSPSADLRYWGSLPSKIYAASLTNAPATGNISVEYGSAAKPQRVPLALNTTSGNCGFSWARTRSALAAEEGGSSTVAANPLLSEENRIAQNSALRDQVVQTFAGVTQ